METLKSLREKAKSAGVKYYYRMNMKELVSALFLKGINPYDEGSKSLSEVQQAIIDDVQGYLNYDKAILALADVYPEGKNNSLFMFSFFFLKYKIISILKFRNDTCHINRNIFTIK